MHTLLANINGGGIQWSTDLIGSNALPTYPSLPILGRRCFGNHVSDHTQYRAPSRVLAAALWSATVSTETRRM